MTTVSRLSRAFDLLKRRGMNAPIAAALFLLSAVLQVGCGVVHCLADASAEESTHCHDAGHEEPVQPDADHEESGGACCIRLPLEASFTGSLSVAPPMVLAVSLEVAPGLSSATHRVAAGFDDTGPPATVAAPVPLRI